MPNKKICVVQVTLPNQIFYPAPTLHFFLHFGQTVHLKRKWKARLRLNHNKGSKSVPLFMKNQLSYTPFILLPQVYIAFHSTFQKNSDIQLLSFIFYTTLKLLPTWLSQTLQICERSYFMLKIVAKTPRISLYSSYLHI